MICHNVLSLCSAHPWQNPRTKFTDWPFRGGKGDSMRRAAADIVHMMEDLLRFCLSGIFQTSRQDICQPLWLSVTKILQHLQTCCVQRKSLVSASNIASPGRPPQVELHVYHLNLIVNSETDFSWSAVEQTTTMLSPLNS
eukprot:s40_g38.t1